MEAFNKHLGARYLKPRRYRTSKKDETRQFKEKKAAHIALERLCDRSDQVTCEIARVTVTLFWDGIGQFGSQFSERCVWLMGHFLDEWRNLGGFCGLFDTSCKLPF